MSLRLNLLCWQRKLWAERADFRFSYLNFHLSSLSSIRSRNDWTGAKSSSLELNALTDCPLAANQRWAPPLRHTCSLVQVSVHRWTWRCDMFRCGKWSTLRAVSARIFIYSLNSGCIKNRIRRFQPGHSQTVPSLGEFHLPEMTEDLGLRRRGLLQPDLPACFGVTFGKLLFMTLIADNGCDGPVRHRVESEALRSAQTHQRQTWLACLCQIVHTIYASASVRLKLCWAGSLPFPPSQIGLSTLLWSADS